MARIKISLIFDSDARIGPGKAALLESVRDTGSISATARAMGMDYKRAGRGELIAPICPTG
jgi:molybdate transport system regulatory protein